MEIRCHSHTAQAAYHDLVSLLLDDSVSDILGTPTLREVSGRGNWYDRYRLGTEMKERYLGEDNPQLKERVQRHESLQADRRARRKERARLVRLSDHLKRRVAGNCSRGCASTIGPEALRRDRLQWLPVRRLAGAHALPQEIDRTGR